MKPRPDPEAQRAALIDALQHGRVAEARKLRTAGARLFPEGAVAGLILQVYAQFRQRRIFTEQLDPDHQAHIVPFQQVAEACGPFYQAQEYVNSEPTPGWLRAAAEDRILSVYEPFGQALVAHQLLGDPAYYVASKTLSPFRHSLIAGPFTPPTEHLPEHLASHNWDRLGLRPDTVDIQAYKNIFFEYMRLRHNVCWTRQFGRLQELEGVIGDIAAAWQSLSPHPELYILGALLQADPNRTTIILNKAIELDQALSPLARLILFHRLVLHIAFSKESGETDMPPCPEAAREEWSNAVLLSSIKLLTQREDCQPTLSELEPFTKYIGRSERPYESIMIEDNCRAIASRLWTDFSRLAAACGNEPNSFVQAFTLGARFDLGAVFMQATMPGYTELLASLVSQGVPARGSVTPLGNLYELTVALKQNRSDPPAPRPGYFVPIAQAVNYSDEQAVKLLLDHGADPHEPSHFGGRSSIQLADDQRTSQAIKRLLALHPLPPSAQSPSTASPAT
jgi:hypothetical protein